MFVWNKNRLESKRVKGIIIILLQTRIKSLAMIYKREKYLYHCGTNGETECLEEDLWH